MAYVNVLDWKAEQVADWLRGLEDTVYPYAHFFLNNDVTGQVKAQQIAFVIKQIIVVSKKRSILWLFNILHRFSHHHLCVIIPPECKSLAVIFLEVEMDSI